MTEFNLPATAVGGIALALVAAVSMIFLPSIVETETALQTPAGGIQAINAAHLVKSCLEAGNSIPKSLLDSSEGKGICDICGDELRGLCMSRTEIGIKVRDLEGPGEWVFNYAGIKEHKAEIFLNILHETGKTTLGRLYAEI